MELNMDNITTAGMTQVILEYKPVFDEDGNPVMEDCSIMDPYGKLTSMINPTWKQQKMEISIKEIKEPE